eukprot:TRINITY_DN926_c0_g2_i1.p1 TRINITY_DN926_c0_g2~~TRINITY_DN926_c0_g2_i1.p1  ORF type:complete len:797 (-),score=180.16 TRINITY_DN926_c0_g2_i1:22-2412(-)
MLDTDSNSGSNASEDLDQQVKDVLEDEDYEENEIMADIEDKDMLAWTPTGAGRVHYGYVGPLVLDTIGIDGVKEEMEKEDIDGLDEQILHKLRTGVNVVRINNSNKHHKEHLSISEDGMFLKIGKQKGWQGHGYPLPHIMELRRGQKTRVFERHKLLKGTYSTHSDRSMSILFDKQTLNIVFHTVEECDEWWRSISIMVNKAKKADYMVIFLELLWNRFHKKTLKPKQVKKMLRIMNFKTSKYRIYRLFMEVDRNADGAINFDQFIDLVRKLTHRPEIGDLFYQYSEGLPTMNALQLSKFFTECQEEPHCTPARCEEFIHNQEEGMTLETFEKMMNAPLNMGYILHHHEKVYHDMDQPLSMYFVASSHNTYLEKNQLMGFSATNMYIHSLRAGFKCIEIDTWDGPHGEPIIYHGHTLVTKIHFIDVIKVIGDYAFIKSPYPVIISIENHCCIEQQQKMAKYFVEVFGDKLAILDPTAASLPSPNQLKNKIVLKGKMTKMITIGVNDTSLRVANNDGVATELSKLTYLKLTDLAPFVKDPKQATSGPVYEMLNFSEGKLKKLVKQQPREISEYNRTHLSRVYTKGSRLMSSNYTPCLSWAAGCQLVAYNIQTPGDAKYIHDGMFADNGGSGYILKPYPVSYQDCHHDPHAHTVCPKSRIHKIRVTILSGRNLPVSKIHARVHPFIIVQINGLPSDVKSHHTKIASINALNPTWDETFEFEVRMSQLAVLTIKACSYFSTVTRFGYEHIGHFSARVENIRPGYRVVPLTTHEGYQTAVGNLFCKFEMLPHPKENEHSI